jgi:voltage-gated sodium channel
MPRPEPDNKLWRLVESPLFTTAILLVIVANAVVLGLQTYDGVVSRHGDTLELLNDVFLGIFVVELALRFGAYSRRPQDFFRNGWNVFDLIVIGLALVPGLRANTTLLRLARLARVVRIVRLLPDLRVLLLAVLRSLPPLASMLALTTVMLFVYGMVGWLLFGDELAERWGNIGAAMLTLVILLTLENFPIYLEQGMDVYPWAWVYFVSFALVTAFILLNVLIGIVLNSMEEARELERRRPVSPDEVAPVTERIAILRSALDELERELEAADARR